MSVTVYFISDHTGLTVEALGRMLLSQFQLTKCDYHIKSYVNTVEKAQQLAIEIIAKNGGKIIVFSSFVNAQLREVFSKNKIEYIDLFSEFIPRLETILEKKSSAQTGLAHGVGNYHKYMLRIEAIDFALAHDDGLNNKHYEDADLVLIGVSRSGKTPTCLYLAIQLGIKAANYPITADDLHNFSLPLVLSKVKHKLFGLLIDVNRLQEIRNERRPNSTYSSLVQCQQELDHVHRLYKNEKIPFLDTTSLSIEEISTQILLQTGIEKRF
ncbi:MAG: hypothetical protein A3E87_06055 [Gammaproteobacteria bacterium RIFCSPHIGHO2_12_FULL_35_23]|nr:MAG: hypothetical protein A3E87_06055 [Gammaproteobacteria bacterium RIFCSPHIGHO2_12_FULL_35_23]